MHKNLLFIFALLFSVGLHGQNIQSQFEERVKAEIEGKDVREAKIAFDQMLDELNSGHVILNGETREISDKDAKKCREKAFNAYVNIFLKYATNAIEKGHELDFVSEEANRLLNYAQKGGNTETKLKNIIRKASANPDTRESTPPSGSNPSPSGPSTAQLAQRINHLKRDTANLASANRKLENEIKELEAITDGRNPKAKTDAIAKAKEWESKYNRLHNALFAQDELLWKECIVFPLWLPYDQKRIDDALIAISSYSRLGFCSELFKSVQTTYEPMLREYGEYNRQLISHLQKQISFINSKQQALGKNDFNIPYDSWKNDLKKLSYYSFYEKGSGGIHYLDERIKEYEDLLARKPKDTEALKQALQDIIRKLQPKQ